MGFNQQDVLKKLNEFQEECPEGFFELRKYIGELKAGKIFTAEDYLVMFDALVATLDVNAAWRLLQNRGFVCSKSPLEKVIIETSRFMSKYDWEHPLDVEIHLTEDMEKKVRNFINGMLRKYGYRLNDIRLKSYYISKLNGERFSSREIYL